MDHLVISEKVACVSQMVRDSKYSIEDVINECSKTRVLCAFCHVIHTRNQRMDGLFLPKTII